MGATPKATDRPCRSKRAARKLWVPTSRPKTNRSSASVVFMREDLGFIKTDCGEGASSQLGRTGVYRDQIGLRLSSRNVTGPSLTSETFIIARKTPVAISSPEGKSRSV